MFARKKKYKSGRYAVQIVESKRVGGKIKQTIVKHVGSATDERSIEALYKTAEYMIHELENGKETWLFPIEYEKIEEYNVHKEEKDLPVNLRDIHEEKRVIRWIQDVYGKLYDEIGFDKVVSNPQRNVWAIKCLKQITLARIASPKSKKASVEMLDRDYGISLNLDTVYNMMKKITDKEIDNIQSMSYQYTKNVFNEKLDMLFLDGTTLYFESEVEDNLRKPWYGKEGKPQDGKVLLLLMVTKEWLPVGYKLYPWNQYEGHTLQPMVEMMESKYNIGNIFLSADSGFFNKENITYLEERNYSYVLWARIKSLPKVTREEVTDGSNYIVTQEDANREVLSSYKEIEYNGKRLILTYSKARADKDRKQREKQLETLRKYVGKDVSSVGGSFGYKKYMKKVDEKISVDEEKIKTEAQRDGLKGIVTNDYNKTVWEITTHYQRLWKIEESFRVNKHDLLIRPIFHRTEQKIRAHIAISYMAFVLVRQLEYRMKLAWSTLSPERIRTELLHIQGSILKDRSTDKRYFLPSSISGVGESIYKAVGKKRYKSAFELQK